MVESPKMTSTDSCTRQTPQLTDATNGNGAVEKDKTKINTILIPNTEVETPDISSTVETRPADERMRLRRAEGVSILVNRATTGGNDKIQGASRAAGITQKITKQGNANEK